MKRFGLILPSLLLVLFLTGGCSRGEDQPLPTETTAIQNPLTGEAGIAFAEKLSGIYEGSCCQYFTEEDRHINFPATNEVIPSGEENASLLIDGIRFFHVSGIDISSDVITYKSVDGYGADVIFRKNASIMNKDVSYSTIDGSGTINCDTYREVSGE